MEYICIPTLVVIAQAVYFSQHRHTKAKTQLITISYALATIDVQG